MVPMPHRAGRRCSFSTRRWHCPPGTALRLLHVAYALLPGSRQGEGAGRAGRGFAWTARCTPARVTRNRARCGTRPRQAVLAPMAPSFLWQGRGRIECWARKCCLLRVRATARAFAAPFGVGHRALRRPTAGVARRGLREPALHASVGIRVNAPLTPACQRCAIDPSVAPVPVVFALLRSMPRRGLSDRHGHQRHSTPQQRRISNHPHHVLMGHVIVVTRDGTVSRAWSSATAATGCIALARLPVAWPRATAAVAAGDRAGAAPMGHCGTGRGRFVLPRRRCRPCACGHALAARLIRPVGCCRHPCAASLPSPSSPHSAPREC